MANERFYTFVPRYVPTGTYWGIMHYMYFSFYKVTLQYFLPRVSATFTDELYFT